MTDPASRAKPVGPPPSGEAPRPPVSSPPGTGPNQPPPDPGSYQNASGAPPPGQPTMRVYSWSSSGRSFPWLAVLLLVLGIGLLIELLVPDLSFGSLIILAAGLAFGVAWLYGKAVGATMPALVLTGWGLAGVLTDVGVLTGDGWGTLSIGLAFLIGWGLGRYQHARREWALWLGLILGLIGLADVSDTLPFDVSLVVIIPLAMIGIGVYLVFRNRLPQPG
jgi:hypothetical protein